VPTWVVALPRNIRPGVTYMITRRCFQRTFRLRPSDETNRIFRYCLGLAAKRTGVLLHAVCVMSNHHHLVVTDVLGTLPDFVRELHRLVAKALNASQGQWENLWSTDRCHFLELGDDDDIIAKIAYLAANPVEAGLVASPQEWPGVMHLPRQDEYFTRVERPAAYFGARSSAPEEIELRIAPPRWIERLVERVDAAVQEKVEAMVAKMREEGWSFLGRAGVLATSFVKRARSYEERRKLIPQIAARSRTLRKRLLEAQREFRRAYFGALELWRRGARDAVFPAGTWWLRVFHGVAVANGNDAASALTPT
jgi:REP element-mobilizing transposase RayT